MDKNWEKAEAELLYSEKLGMDPQTVQGILSMDISRNARVMRFLRWGGIGLALWLISLGGLFLVGIFLRRSSMQSGNEALASQDVQIEPEPHRVSSMYQWVINILPLYFYLSVPFVILLVVLLAGVAFYAFFLNHIIPVQVSLVLVILLAISLVAMLRALIPHFQDILPGSWVG